jgi:hypothetical protein
MMMGVENRPAEALIIMGQSANDIACVLELPRTQALL